MSRGAGGTEGGLGQFFIGFIMMCGGFYMLFNSIMVTSRFGMGMSLFAVSGFGITSGMIMIPFIFGTGIIFYNSRNYLGWALAIGSLSAMVFGVIASINFTMRQMSAFDLVTILILAIGGTGLLLRSLRDMNKT